jgi:hypothetical protein
MVMIIKESEIIKTIFPPQELKELQKYAMKMWSTQPNYDKSFGRHQWADTEELKKFHELLTEFAREHFESETLKPSWCLMSVYEGKDAKLWKHKDDNACVYHINLCVFQKTPWEFWVEGKPYLLEENDALMTYGNDLEHWREEFPDPDNNLVCNAFFFFCEPDHWYFTEGPEYLYTNIRAPQGGL